MDDFIMQAMNIISSVIPQAIVVGICLYYLLKSASIEAFLLCIGAFLGLIITLFYVVLLPYFFNNGIFDSISDAYMIVITIANIVSFIASMLFAIGLILLINKYLKSKEPNHVKNSLF